MGDEVRIGTSGVDKVSVAKAILLGGDNLSGLTDMEYFRAELYMNSFCNEFFGEAR